jgi:catechol 2,3-dioxygenase
MGHIHLKVASIPVAREFYVDTLGFELMVDWAGSALFVAAGGYHHHLGLNNWQSRQAPPLPDDAYGLAQFEIHFATQDARQATVNRLQEAKHTFEQTDTGLVVRDPFNLTLVLR